MVTSSANVMSGVEENLFSQTPEVSSLFMDKPLTTVLGRAGDEDDDEDFDDEEEEDEDEDSFTYEQCKKQILINPKLNEEGELEFSMTKKNLEKFINKKVSSSEEQYKVTVNIFNKGMNIFYVEDGKKEQKKLLKFRFNKYHSVINDYLSSL